MLKTGAQLNSLIRKMIILMAIYTLLRILFLLTNHTTFTNSKTSDIILSFCAGLRFDWVALTIINLPLYFTHLLPYRYFTRPVITKLNFWLFLILNLPFITANCIDLELFKFSSRRLTADIFSIMGYGHDFVNTTPKMIADFWQATLLLIILTWIIIKAYKRFVTVHKHPVEENHGKLNWWSPIIILILGFLGFRGGVQYKPLSILSASAFQLNKEVPLVLNSSFTLIKTIGEKELHRTYFFDEQTATHLCPVVHLPKNGEFRKMNVVNIIMEGIGKEYIGSMNGNKGFTPFLDSLFSHSLLFTQAFANGKRSIEGIPAVVAGIPSLNDLPYITSPYADNKINTLANLLKPYGYTSIFFHGGTNGTMGFDGFSIVAGFDRYFGRSEYGNADFDGNWGVYDMPFLQRVVTELNQIKGPFVSTIFTLSSHHPYLVPPPYNQTLPKGTLPNHQSVRYTDASLRAFFNAASKCAWFENTLFVITSDHTTISNQAYYQTKTGIYAIPVAFYIPGDKLSGVSDRTTQQIDILPSTLDYLHFPEPYFALGTSVFDSTATPYAINFLLDNNQLIANGYSYTLDTLNGSSLHNYINDPLLTENLITKEISKSNKMDSMIKAVVQQYTTTILENKTSVAKDIGQR